MKKKSGSCGKSKSDKKDMKKGSYGKGKKK